MFLYVIAVNLRHIANQVAAGVHGVNPGAAGDGVKAREKEGLLCKGVILLAADLLEEGHGAEADLALVAGVGGEALAHELGRQAEISHIASVSNSLTWRGVTIMS